MEPAAAVVEEPGASTAKIATAYIIWIVRIALPIIFFWVWYRTQPEKASWYSLPHEVSLSRDELLRVRKAAGLSAAPQPMANIRVSREGELPTYNDRARSAPRGGAKRDVKPKNAEEPPREPQREPPRDQAAASPSQDERQVAQEAEADTGAKDGKEPLADEERAQVEKLVNYITFSHRDRPRRVFLPDGQPPPPPKKSLLFTPAAATDLKELTRANADAQVVLRCVSGRKIDMRPSDISKALYDRLSQSKVRVTEATLSLMADTCANAGDLKGASDYLMKMEAAGHCPDSALLDKVMDLFSEEKDQKEDQAQAGAVPRGSDNLGESRARAGGPALHPWASAKESQESQDSQLHALNFGAYSEDEGE